MKVFMYSVSKKYLTGVMKGKVIHGYDHGYVFAEDSEDAIRKLETKYPSDKSSTYGFSYEETSFISLKY